MGRWGRDEDRVILAIDTALAAASACLLVPGEARPYVAETLPMASGHAEALFPLLDRIVSRAEGGFDALTRIAVTIGPGSFTGIRIGVAAGRAIGLAKQIPVVGVSTLSALAAPLIAAGARPPIVAAIDARHGNIYVQSFGAFGETLFGPALLSAAEAARALGNGPLRLVGSGSRLLAAAAAPLGISTEIEADAMAADIAFVAQLGALAEPDRALPRPLYLKAPDATPPTGPSLLRGP